MNSDTSIILSLIIPLYNTESYIKQCLSSIVDNKVDQTRYEVIVIDDGSSDVSPTIVKEYCEAYPNVYLYSQENKGVSVARMNGVAKAKGEYIWFIDSDDFLLEGSIGQAIRLIDMDPSVDTIVSPLIIHFEDSGDEFTKPDTISASETLSGRHFLKRKPTSVCPPQFIFKKDLFHNKWLYFPERLRHEDEYFCRVLQYISKSMMLHPEPMYVYRQWGGSFMYRTDTQSLYDMVEVYRLMSSFIDSQVDGKDRDWLHSDIFDFLMGTHSWHYDQLTTKEFRDFRKINLPFIEKEYNKFKNSLSLRDRLLCRLLLKHPGLFSLLLKVKNTLKCKTH